MTLSTLSKRWLQDGLGNVAAATELDNLLSQAFGGTVFYVSSDSGVGSNLANGLSWQEPFATLTYALTKVTAAKGDIIVLMPGYAETTTALAVSTAATRIIGVGTGANRPTLTATTAATDLMNVTAANCYIENVRFVGAASGCTALLDIAADDFTGVNLHFNHGAAPLSAVTVPGAWSRGQLIDCTWRGTAAGPDYSIYLENGATTGKIVGWRIVRPRAFYSQSSGLDNAFLRADRKVQDLYIEQPVVIAFDTLAVDINSSSAAVGDGVVSDGSFVASTALTSIEDAFDVGGMVFKQCYVSDDASKAAGRAPISSAS